METSRSLILELQNSMQFPAMRWLQSKECRPHAAVAVYVSIPKTPARALFLGALAER